MLIYEVNLEVDDEINYKMAAYLQEHLQQMLTFTGFRTAYWFFRRPEDEENAPQEKTLWTIQYVIDKREDLDDYLKNHAQKMRAETVEKFGDRFKASRRILNLLGVAGLSLDGKAEESPGA
jgi:hypothetical protein